MYYAAYEGKSTKQKRWKVFGNKQEVFDYFKKITPKSIPESNDLKDLNESVGNKWEIVKLNADTRKRLEKHFDTDSSQLEGKGEYLPDLVEKI
jgi:hypothetical protein